jgi:hypothetical protein
MQSSGRGDTKMQSSGRGDIEETGTVGTACEVLC